MRQERTERDRRARSEADFPQASHGSDPRNPRASRVSGPDRAGEAARFWAKVERQGNGCWLWTGATTRNGYGRLRAWLGRWTHVLAHRWAYEHTHGPIPYGLTLDHTCHSDDPSCPGGKTCPHRRCVNPDHLEPVDDEENRRRARERRAT